MVGDIVNKTKIIIIIVSTILIIYLMSFFLLFNRDNEETFDNKIEEDEIKLNTSTIEVYSDTKLSDVLDLSNGIELIEDYKINTDKVGKIKLNVLYKDSELNERKGYLEINVVDTTPPFIGIGDHYSHIINTDFTFSKDVLCKDNYDRKVKCEIIGDYDINKLGVTNLKIVAIDSSNNKTEKEFEFRVIEKKDVKETPSYKSIDEIKIPDNASLMIDVSKWQEDIDWQQVKDAGVDYVMMRLGTQKAVDKGSVLDSYFEKNIKGAQAVGIKVGVYYFSYANDVNDAKEQAEWVVEQLKDYKIDLPVSFDWECWEFFNDFDINLHEFNEMGNTFLKIIEDNGYTAINYGSKIYFDNIWETFEYKTWLAHYTKETTYDKDYLIWQFSDKGRIPGIEGNVDLDFYYNK
jgi:GH25 family lysozyme M1 (1,4-beta-N-acetylmuramidase)